MKKLLYAINHRQTENLISEYLASEYLPVGAVTYKEAIIEQLHMTGAEVVLIRDTLARINYTRKSFKKDSCGMS